MDSNLPLSSTHLTLSTLPLEILLHIQTYLPTHAAALFTLTSKSIWSRLGAGAMLRLRGEYREIAEARKFVLILERDLPGYYACHECLVFHLLDDLPSSSDDLTRVAQIKLCMKYDILAEKRLFQSVRIHYLDLRGAMQAMDATAQRAALQNLTVRTENTTVEFALQPNKIVMRGRHFIKCATGDRSDAFERDFLFNVHICDHVRRFGEFGSEIVQLTHCRPYKLRQDPLSKECAAEKYCSLCPTEFESHTVSLNEAKYLFIITR